MDALPFNLGGRQRPLDDSAGVRRKNCARTPLHKFYLSDV